MKKTLLSLSAFTIISLSIIACGGGEDKSSPSSGTETAAGSDDLSSNPVYQKGLELTGKYQCPTCHKIDEKLTGPSYKEVSAKYAGADEATIDKLAQKIIDGGAGVWGDVMMTPHPDVSKEDAKAMVQYILLLKK